MTFEKQPPNPLDHISEQILFKTPLHYACYKGDGHFLDTLIGRTLLYNNNSGEASAACVGALISQEDDINGWTPAHWAAYYGQLSCLMKLHVKPYIGFDTPTHRSNISPLHLAAQSGAVLCLKWLLQCGASRNKQDFMGETPLHKAARAGNSDCASILVSHGASLDLRNYRGLKPCELAVQSNYLTLAHNLKEAMEHAEQSDVISRPLVPEGHLQESDTHRQQDMSSHILMNGERICNTCPADSVEMEEDLMTMTQVSSLNEECLRSAYEESLAGGVKRSFDDLDEMDDISSSEEERLRSEEKQLGGMKRSVDDSDDVDSHAHKRICFAPSSQKSLKERNGDAYNNNILSSYNAVLAVRTDAVTGSRYDTGLRSSSTGSPVSPQSSLMEHQASIAAQRGYDSFVTSAFH